MSFLLHVSTLDSEQLSWPERGRKMPDLYLDSDRVAGPASGARAVSTAKHRKSPLSMF